MKVRKTPDHLQRLCVLRPKDPAAATALAEQLVEGNFSTDDIFKQLLEHQPHLLAGLITDTGKENLQEESICDGYRVLGPIQDGDVVGVYEAMTRLGLKIGEAFDCRG